MTVKELIEHLQTLDPDTHVFVKGYEGGFEGDISLKGPLEIALNINSEDGWWYGPHDIVNEITDKSKYTIVKGIIIKYE